MLRRETIFFRLNMVVIMTILYSGEGSGDYPESSRQSKHGARLMSQHCTPHSSLRIACMLHVFLPRWQCDRCCSRRINGRIYRWLDAKSKYSKLYHAAHLTY